MHLKSQITKVEELARIVLTQLKFLVLGSSEQNYIKASTEGNLLC